MLDLEQQHHHIVRTILNTCIPNVPVLVFGSRSSGTSRPMSDLDLAIMSNMPIDLLTLGLLKNAFMESDLPFRVDLVDWSTTSEAFRNIIQKTAQPFS